MARKLVSDVQQHFLEARHAQLEAAALHAIGILDGAVKHAAQDVDQALAGVGAARARLRKGSRSSTVHGLQAEGQFGKMPDGPLLALRQQILERRSVIDSLEQGRRAELAQVEGQISELRAQYSDDYPTLADALQRAEALRKPSAAVKTLRDQERDLVADFVHRGGRDVDLAEVPTQAFPPELELNDPRLLKARDQLREATDRYSDLRDRLQTAQLELEASKAGFSDGYAVVRAPNVPLRPFSPDPKKTLAGGAVAGLLLAFASTLFFDLRRGRLLERWQVERAVGPVLAEVPEQ